MKRRIERKESFDLVILQETFNSHEINRMEDYEINIKKKKKQKFETLLKKTPMKAYDSF